MRPDALPIVHSLTALLVGAMIAVVTISWIALRRIGTRGALGHFLLGAGGLLLLSLGQLTRSMATSVEWIDFALRIYQCGSLLAVGGMNEVFRLAAGIRKTLAHRIAYWGCVILGAYCLVSPGGIQFHAIQATRLYEFPWGETVSIPVARYSFELYGEVAFFIFCLCLMGWSALHHLRSPNRSRAIFMLLTVITAWAALLRLAHHGHLQIITPPFTEIVLVPVLVLAAQEAITQHDNWAGELQDALASVRTNQARFSAILENAQTLMGLLDTEGRLLVANRRALDIIGKDSDGIVGLAFESLPWWSHSSALQNRVRLGVARAARGETDRFQATHPTKGGGEIVVDFSLTPFHGPDGNIEFMVAEGRDVTDLVRFEESARAEQRLEVIGQLAGGVAHDFNNMLSGIIGAAELASSESDQSIVKEHLGIVLSAAQRATSLTKQLLHFARRGGTRHETYPIDEHLKATIALFERTSGNATKVVARLNAPDLRVLGDSAFMQSAVLNLLVNARDALGGTGTITLETRMHELDEQTSARFPQPLEPGQYIELSVSDDGPGIPPDILPKVFEPFFTTKEPGKGTGLGLAAVQNCVRDHRGSVQVTSVPGRGTRFTIELPVSPIVSENESKVRAYAPAYAYGRHALLVDDEPIVRNSMTRMLKHLGYAVTVEEDALTALSHHAGPSQGEGGSDEIASFAVAVLDYHMPQMNGAELARILRERNPGLPIILMSGNFGDKALDDLKREPLVRMLAKPALREDLVTNLLELGAIEPRRPS